jgi:hypothetical protein
MNGIKNAFKDPKNLTVKEKQELLNLLGYGIEIDGKYGPATKRAEKLAQESLDQRIKNYQTVAGTEVYPLTWMDDVLDRFTKLDQLGTYHNNPEVFAGKMFSDVVLEIARAYADCYPPIREVGGNNRGPWIRFFCREGDIWCALFACGTVLEQAEQLWENATLRLPYPKGYFNTGWTPTIAERAKKLKRLFMGNEFKRLKPGDLFLCERDTGDALNSKRIGHVGIVENVYPDHVFTTIEGNARDSSTGRDGVVRKIRDADNQKYYFVDLS